jgi:hypothetical protein
MVVLGGAEHHEQLGAIQVRSAELPEGAADRVDHARGHVHGAESAVGGVVGRAELPCEEARQRLHLVAAGEEGEFLRVFRPDGPEARFQHREGFVPGNALELARAALAAALAAHGMGEAGRRLLLHDAGGALGADHALVERVRGIAVDIADRSLALRVLLQMHANAAAARAHVARRGFRLGEQGAILAGRLPSFILICLQVL